VKSEAQLKNKLKASMSGVIGWLVCKPFRLHPATRNLGARLIEVTISNLES
jgi:hypothetical protein